MFLTAGWLTWGACVEAPPAEPPPSHAPAGSRTSLEDEVPQEIPDPTPTLMRALASGTTPIDRVLDTQRGFVLIEVAGEAEGERIALRVCGSRAKRELEVLRGDLAARSKNGTENVFTCDSAVCVHPQQGSGDYSGSYAFQAPDGHLVLGVVVRMGDPPASTAAQRRMEEWVDKQLRRLVSEGCP